MNLINRLIVVLGIVVLILFAVMLIVLAWAYSGESIHRLSLFVQYLTDHDTTLPKVIITLGGAFIILIAFSFLLLEIVPRADKTVLVRDVGMGTAVLSTAAVARRLEQIVADLPDVEAVRATVSRRKDAVEVNLQVMVHPESDLALVASEVSRTTQEGVTEQMSVALARPPRLRLYYSTRPPARPRTPAAVEEPHRVHARRPRVVSQPEEAGPPAEAAIEAPPTEPSPPPADASAPPSGKP
ncbi:MAG: alkaline shock response membrane anchor protein AmaP [Dehalococcoidia bacterium]|jgi:multidrug efflux pump subunit AcrB